MFRGIDYSALRNPFPSEMNVHAVPANQRMLEWAIKFDILPKRKETSSILQRMDYGLLGARVHPRASAEALQIADDWICWLFCGDDEYDETDEGRRSERLEQLHARYMAILDGEVPIDRDPARVQALADLYGRLRQLASAECIRRFYQGTADYLAAVRWEVNNREAGAVPDPASYRQRRLDTSAVYPCFELIDITEEICLPVAVRDRAEIQQLNRCANNVISWCNDILSLGKEMIHGDVHNLVIVLREHHRTSLQDAIGMAIDLHNAEVDAYLRQEALLPSFGPQIDAQVERYLWGLRSWMRGNMDWGFTTTRYAAASDIQASPGASQTVA